MTVEDVLIRIQAGLDLEAETEHEVLEETRGHLEEAVTAGVARGLTPEDALAQAAAGSRSSAARRCAPASATPGAAATTRLSSPSPAACRNACCRRTRIC